MSWGSQKWPSLSGVLSSRSTKDIEHLEKLRLGTQTLINPTPAVILTVSATACGSAEDTSRGPHVQCMLLLSFTCVCCLTSCKLTEAWACCLVFTDQGVCAATWLHCALCNVYVAFWYLQHAPISAFKCETTARGSFLGFCCLRNPVIKLWSIKPINEWLTTVCQQFWHDK